MRSLAVAAQQAINSTEKEKALVTAALVARQLQVLLLCCALLRRWQIPLKSKTKQIIDELTTAGYRDIVLLTCKTEATSILNDSVNNGKYRNKYLFTTCRKFKGLEADVVILLDVDKTTFEQDNVLLFYVGASRARIKLEITAMLNDDDCKEILMAILNYRGKVRRAKKDLAGALNAIGSLDV